MAVSKHRRKSKGTRKKILSGTLASNDFPFVAVMDSIVLEKYRHNSDFHALVKVGRLMNALTFAVQVQSDNDGTTWVGQRQIIRARWILIGYLFEGIKLIETLAPTYSKSNCFKLFDQLLSPEFEESRKMLRILRNNMSFHLDLQDRITGKAMDIVDADQHNFMSADARSVTSTYFNFSDFLDWIFMVDALWSEDDDDPTQRVLDSATVISDLMIDGAKLFINGLGERLDIWTLVPAQRCKSPVN